MFEAEGTAPKANGGFGRLGGISATVLTGGGAGTPVPPANGRVSNAIAIAHQLTEGIASSLQQFEARISDVLRPDHPQGANDIAKEAQAIPSNAAGAVETLNGKLQMVLAYIERLTSRVDL